MTPWEPAVRGAAAVSVVGAAAMLGVLAVSPLWQPGGGPEAGAVSRMAPEGDVHHPVAGEPLRIGDFAGPAPVTVLGVWKGEPVLVLKLELGTLAAAAAQHGYNTGQHAVAVPGEPYHVLLAYGAKNTHLGCSVIWEADLGANRDVADYDRDGQPDGRFLSPCHHEQYDAYDLGMHLPGTPAPRPLDVFPLAWDGDGTLLATDRIVQDTERDADRQGLGAPFRLAG